jgi:hypothetical protein
MRILLFCFTVFVFACNSPRKDVLPQSKMQAVLWDLMMADELNAYYMESDSSFAGIEKHIDEYQSVLKIHKLTKAQFLNSLRYYENRPASMKQMLDSLQTYGERLQKIDTTKKKLRPPFHDSIKAKRIIPIPN